MSALNPRWLVGKTVASVSRTIDTLVLHFTDGSYVVIGGHDNPNIDESETVVEVNYYKADR